MIDSKDLRIDYFRGSGPGGQRRNTSETGVRVTHMPSGLVATATESRSRQMNLQRALARLEEKVDARKRTRRPRTATRPSKASVKRRLEGKQRLGTKKQLRRPVKADE